MTRSIRLIITVAAVVFIAALTLRAQEANEKPQPIQEVFQTELVYPQEKGETQFTFSPTFGTSASRNIFQTPLTIEYGLTDKWQIEIEWDGVGVRRELGERTARGTGDLRLGTKYSFMNMRGSNFHSAVGLEIGLPTGNVEKGLSEGLFEFEPYFILARDFPKLNGAQLFTQIGVGFVHRVKRPADENESEPAAHEFSWNTGVFVPFRQMRFTSELNWQTNRWNRGGEDSQLYLTPGLVWHPSGTWEVGIGFPVGLNRNADNLRSILKLSYEF